MSKNNEDFAQSDKVSNELVKNVASKPVNVICPRCNKKFDLNKAKHECPHCGFIFLSTTVDIR